MCYLKLKDTGKRPPGRFSGEAECEHWEIGREGFLEEKSRAVKGRRVKERRKRGEGGQGTEKGSNPLVI